MTPKNKGRGRGKSKGRGRSGSKGRGRGKGRGRSGSKGRGRSGSRSNKVIPPLERGTLTTYGYHFNKSDMARHRALNKAFKAHGYSKLVHKLNAIAVLNKNRHDEITEIAHEDMAWLKDKYR